MLARAFGLHYFLQRPSKDIRMARRKGGKSGKRTAPNRKSPAKTSATGSVAPKRPVAAKPRKPPRKVAMRVIPRPRPRKSLARRAAEVALRPAARLRAAMARSSYDVDLDRNP